MPRLVATVIVLALSTGIASLGVAPSETGAPVPTTATLLEMANGTGSAHPTMTSQGGRAQLIVVLFNDVIVPAGNLGAGPPALDVDNGTIEINDTADAGTPADKAAAAKGLWDLRARLGSIVAGSMGRGTVNGTAATLAGVETRLVRIESARLETLTTALGNAQPKSAAFGSTLKELIALRARIAELATSNTEGVRGAATTALGKLDELLLESIPRRAEELLTVLQSDTATAAAKNAAAKELAELRTAMVMTRGSDNTLEPRIHDAVSAYYASRARALIRILDDSNSTATAKTAALNELRAIRDALRGLSPDRATMGDMNTDPATATLGDIEKKLADLIAVRVRELTGILDDPDKSAQDKATALTELINLRSELLGLTAGQTARRNEGDTTHDDLIGATTTRIENEIRIRYNDLSRTLDPDNTAAVTAAVAEWFQAWKRLRDLGRTDTQLYTDLETSLYEAFRREGERLGNIVNNPDASDAERAAAASALIKLRQQLVELDGTRSTPDRPYESPTTYEATETLGIYIRDRIAKAGQVLDSSTSTTAQKNAALAELRQLRNMLIGMGRQPAGTGAGRSDADIAAIDTRLSTVATARLQELTRTLQSSTATTAEKLSALNALEQLRSEFRGLSGDHMDTLLQIDKLLQEGANGLRQQLEGTLDGTTTPATTPLTSSNTTNPDGTAFASVNLVNQPELLATTVSGLENVGLPGGASIAGFAENTGGSMGAGIFDITFANFGDGVNVAGDGLVIEPATGDDAERLRELWPVILARANETVTVSPEGYCLEKEQRPPTAGELFTLSVAGKQAGFADVRRILTAGTELYEAGQLHPEADGDPEQYFHSIRQWAIWTHERGYDEATFTEKFVEHTKKNVEDAGYAWTPEIEEQVRAWAPGRWIDIQNTLTAAGFATV